MRHHTLFRHTTLVALSLALAVPAAGAQAATAKRHSPSRPTVPARPDGKRVRVHDTSRLARAAADYTVGITCVASGAGVDTGGTVTFSISDTEDFGMAWWRDTVYVRSYIKVVRRSTGASTWIDYGSWDSYTVRTNASGQWTDLMNPVIGGTSVGSAVRQIWTVYPGHNVYMGLYVYTQRAGMRFITLAPTDISPGLSAAPGGGCWF